MIVARRPTWVRLLSAVMTPLVLGGGARFVYLALGTPSITLGVAGITAICLGILMPILAFRYRLILTNHSIVAIEFKTRELDFGTISTVEMRYGKVTLKAPSSSISIARDITDRELILSTIAARLSTRTDVRYEGDTDDLIVYFGQQYKG